MAGSSITVVYKDQLSYARQIQGLLQVLIAGYVFYLLVRWQQNTASSDNKYG